MSVLLLLLLLCVLQVDTWQRAGRNRRQCTGPGLPAQHGHAAYLFTPSSLILLQPADILLSSPGDGRSTPSTHPSTITSTTHSSPTNPHTAPLPNPQPTCCSQRQHCAPADP
jgi:hypothetical protein